MEVGTIFSIIGTPLLIFLGLLILFSIREVKQYERGVKFTLGKFSKLIQPGWRIVIPVFQQMRKVDIRVHAVDVPDQEAITEDNISVSISAVIYYRVSDATKAVIEVENYFYAVSQLAQTTMRNAVGEVTLDDLLKNRDKIAKNIKEKVDRSTDSWGIEVQSVELKDIKLPPDLKRTMAKVAEAEREGKSVIVKANAELMASENIAQAATKLANAPGALHLRTLQSVNDMSSDESNTIIFMLPIEVLEALGRIGKK